MNLRFLILQSLSLLHYNHLQNLLEVYLKKWLLLTFRSGDKPYRKQTTFKGVKLPIATNQDQLRLTAVAISIISFRPAQALLKELAICYETMNRNTVI